MEEEIKANRVRLSDGEGNTFLEWAIMSTLQIVKKIPFSFESSKEVKIVFGSYGPETSKVKVQGERVFQFDTGYRYDFVAFLFNAFYFCAIRNVGFYMQSDENSDILWILPPQKVDGKKGIADRLKNSLKKYCNNGQDTAQENDVVCIHSLFQNVERIINEMCISPSELLPALAEMKIQRKKLVERDSEYFPLPKSRNILNYLNTFIEFCRRLFSNGDIFDAGDAKSMHLFEYLLCFESEAPDSGGGGDLKIGLYAPFSLAALRIVYEKLWECIVDQRYKACRNTYADCFVDNIVTSKLLRNFERYYIWQNELYLGTLDRSKTHDPMQTISGYKWRKLSSIVPSAMIDLYEKIMHYIMRTAKEDRIEENQVKICVFGYIDFDLSKDAAELCNYLKYSLAGKPYETEVNLKLILNKLKDNSGIQEKVKNELFKVEEIEYEEKGFSRSFVEDYIKQYDMIFIVDSPQLYKSDLDYITDMPLEEFAKELKASSYMAADAAGGFYSNGIRLMPAIGDQLIFSSLRKEKKRGYVWHDVRTSFCDMLQEAVGEEEKHKEIYLLISGLNKVNIAGYDRLNVTSLENKNGKDISLIRIGNEKHLKWLATDRNLPEPHDKISFNLWNLVKNIAPSLRGSIFGQKRMGDGGKEIWQPAVWELENVIINLEWDYLPDSIPGNFQVLWRFAEGKEGECNFSLLADEAGASVSFEGKKEIISRMLKNLFDMILEAGNTAYFHYVRSGFGNIFMGRLSSLRQLMTYHMLVQNKFQLSGCEYDENFMHQSEYTFDVQDKRMYYEILRALDKENVTEIEYLYNINRARVNGESKTEVLDNIKYTCEELNYTDSNLYRNL